MPKRKDLDLLTEIHTDVQWIKDELGFKANKWVETVMKGAIGSVLLCVLGALLGLVIAPAVMAMTYVTFDKIN